MMPITHGYYVAEESRGGARPQTPQSNKVECDKVVVQREQVEEQEWWFYGVFDTRIGSGVTKYLQTHLFDNNLNEVINKEHENNMLFFTIFLCFVTLQFNIDVIVAYFVI